MSKISMHVGMQGDVVRLHGLQSKLPLNGALALILLKHSEGRWVVRPYGVTSEPVAVRTANMQRGRELPESLRQGLFVAVALSVLLVAVAARAGPRSRLRALVPVASLLWFLVAVLGCYYLHAPLLASGVYVPAISEMGISSSARLLYRVAFGLCGFLLAVTLLQMHDLMSKHHSDISVQDSGLLWGLLASFGITLQGVCTLRLDFGMETVLHLSGAMVTMFGTFSHAERSNGWFKSLPDGSPLLRRGWRGFGLSLRKDHFEALGSGSSPLLAIFMVPLLLQGGKRLGLFAELNVVENCMGIMLGPRPTSRSPSAPKLAL